MTVDNDNDHNDSVLRRMREQLRADLDVLHALPAHSPARARLRRAVEDTATRIANHEESVRQRQIAHQASERERRQRNDALGEVWSGVVFIGIGAVLACTTWPSWWLLLAIVLIVAGVAGTVHAASRL